MSSDTRLRFAGFALFTLAGLSDILDGYIARRDDLVTDLGKLLDPIADKLLLAVTLIPIYLISQRGGPLDELPWIGPLPLWVLFVIFGRELLITIFRAYAARQGVVIAAGWSGKRKAMFQMFFTGAVLLWYPLVDVGLAKGWDNWLWDLGSMGLQAWVPIMLGFALLLTVYSLIDYLWSYRVVVGIRD
tara:strand:- start:610 stop:1173 length:564 start_codon:yes stop_codon:yes gene_type:complete